MAAQDPFPELRFTTWSMRLTTKWHQPVILDLFIGESTPSLRVLCSATISFPGLPKLLLPASHPDDPTLPRINIVDVLPSGYFSSDEMTTALSVLTNLKYLTSNSSFVDSPE